MSERTAAVILMVGAYATGHEAVAVAVCLALFVVNHFTRRAA